MSLHRILAERMAAPDGAEESYYRIFIRDLELLCSIGVHDHEKSAPQRLRVNLDLQVREARRPVDDDIANVLSYEGLVTGIRQIASDGHTNLVETLAERVASFCLEDRRVSKVTVRVEKLDIEPDAASVGVEIERRRKERPAINVYPFNPAGKHLDIPRRRAPMWVVKLGGSLFGSELLSSWLGVLGHSQRRLVIVPGGGPFADQVRVAQHRWRFDDGAAHRMAILAMEQFGYMLCALQSKLTAAGSAEEIDAAHAQGQVAVWLPSRMTLDEPALPERWSVTSDSLAAWLASEIGAERLVLVKSAKLPEEDSRHVRELSELGLLDAGFEDFACHGSFDVWCVSASQHQDLAEALRTGTGAGIRVDVG